MKTIYILCLSILVFCSCKTLSSGSQASATSSKADHYLDLKSSPTNCGMNFNSNGIAKSCACPIAEQIYNSKNGKCEGAVDLSSMTPMECLMNINQWGNPSICTCPLAEQVYDEKSGACQANLSLDSMGPATCSSSRKNKNGHRDGCQCLFHSQVYNSTNGKCEQLSN